jgi:hypothetical protein
VRRQPESNEVVYLLALYDCTEYCVLHTSTFLDRDTAR